MDDDLMGDEFNRSMDDSNNMGSMNNTQNSNDSQPQSKKPRLVFTDIQRRTLQAIFKETKRPSKEMQMTIAQQLGLEVATVNNFFMNARRRSTDKWKEEEDENSNCSSNK
jgi:predicted transcriptional regulator